MQTLRSMLTLRGLRLRIKLGTALSAAGFKDEYALLFLSLVVGAATGLGAHLFYTLLQYAYEFAYGPHGLYGGRAYLLVCLPAAGALLVGLIATYFSSEARGHGVPEVLDGIYRKGGVIRARVSVAKTVCSALSIGSGGSAGTEGPIVQIGAAIGSAAGQIAHTKRQHLNTLVACGVAGGISAIFNAPIAGVLFALEIFLKDYSFRTFSPIVFASVISTSLTHALRSGDGSGQGDTAIFEVNRAQTFVFNGSELPFYLLLGLCCALAAVAFIRALYYVEDLTDLIKVPVPLKPVIGAALMGLIGVVTYGIAQPDGVPTFFGNGYPVIRTMIGPTLVAEATILPLLAMCALKIVATSLTLGSGGSGGIFAPALFIGACIGGAFGLGLHRLGLIEASSASAYAIVGMAAVVAASTHAPLTAIVILYELTRQPRIILPIMFAAIVATGVAQLLFRESIYTLKMVRRGVRIGRLADLTILKRLQADQVEMLPAPEVRRDDPLQKLLAIAPDFSAPDFVVIDENGAYEGMVVADDIKTALLQPEAVPLLLVGELVRPGIPTVSPAETLDRVLDKFAKCDTDTLPIAATGDGHNVVGLITRQGVMDCYQQELEQRG